MQKLKQTSSEFCRCTHRVIPQLIPNTIPCFKPAKQVTLRLFLFNMQRTKCSLFHMNLASNNRFDIQNFSS